MRCNFTACSRCVLVSPHAVGEGSKSTHLVTSSKTPLNLNKSPHMQGHQSAARDGEELCSGVLQQLQGLIGQYKDTGKQLTELGEQLGTAREVLATLDEQLQVPPSHAQYEDLVKVSSGQQSLPKRRTRGQHV